MNEISLDKPIARGRTADVYLWGEDHILKLFHNWFEVESIEYEQRIGRAVHASGVKAPAVGEMVKVQGRNGLIYERIRGISMQDVIMRQPWTVVRQGRLLAELHAQMHNCIFSADVPEQKEKLASKIKHANVLNPQLQSTLLEKLKSMPAGNKVCHGDFHMGNVLITENGGFIIDWIDSSSGNPLADVARTSIIMLATIENKSENIILRFLAHLFHSAYLKRYFSLRPGGIEEYRRWLPIVAAARLSENITQQEKWLIRQAQEI